MLAEFTNWFLDLVTSAFGSLWDLVKDAAVWVFSGILSAVAALLGAIPIPDFAAGGMQGLFNQLPPGVVYLVVQAGLLPALALFGAGYAFRFGRKVLTLFQW